VRARRVVLATGVRDVVPDVEGFWEFYGSDVFHCPTCDGFDARGRCVAVFGWKPHIAGFAAQLLDWAAEIRIITNGRPLDITAETLERLDDAGVEVIEDRVVALLGRRGDLQGVRLASGRQTECSMGFFSIEHEPQIALAQQLGCAVDDDGYVSVNHEMHTTVPGVYAAGDLSPGMQLVGVAVGKGTVAGVACAMSLHGEAALPDTPAPAPDPEGVAGSDD
jgi:thioredoxin reductase